MSEKRTVKELWWEGDDLHITHTDGSKIILKEAYVTTEFVEQDEELGLTIKTECFSQIEIIGTHVKDKRIADLIISKLEPVIVLESNGGITEIARTVQGFDEEVS